MKARVFFTCYDKTPIVLNGHKGFWRWYYFGNLYWFDCIRYSDGKWTLYHCTASGSRRELARRYNLNECLQVAKDKKEHAAADLFATFYLR